jgi:hypothetical protein
MAEELTREQARRIAVRAQLLDEGSPSLIVHAIHEDDSWTAKQRAAVAVVLESLAQWPGLALVLP